MYENTEVNGHRYNKETDTVEITTRNGQTIFAKKVIYSAGYEGTDIKKEKTVSFVSTYTVTTNQIADLSTWYKRTLIWETARPYLYLRTTDDNRIIIGGLDDHTNYPEDRDSKLMHKKNKLIQELKHMFPAIHAEPEFFSAAFYGGTVDGIPIIGKYDAFPNSYFLYAFRDNGTVYSQLLAKLIVQEITEGYCEEVSLYLEDRPQLDQKNVH
ncbi:NAD(P)/FAD-dependent oxidoreductase [Gracilibacillus marinus]|uniref:NAD(P)/FAD-dependent oxidoreductase n=1 Tax=Gracilibacillus marinus TaxID=630535 RepID=A0ABV8VU67_9BACI